MACGARWYMRASEATAAKNCMSAAVFPTTTPHSRATFATVAKECVRVTAHLVATSQFWAFSPKAVLL